MKMNEIPNLDYIKELSAGDEMFEKKFITIIKEEFPREKETYLENLKNENYRETMDIVHKIKHKINILGLQNGYRLAVRYEEELRYGNPGLQTDFLAILKTMETYIKSL